MPKEETFTARIFCPNCRTSGEATCRDTENPARGKFDRVVTSVSPGFQIGGYLDGTQEVFCARCRGLVPI